MRYSLYLALTHTEEFLQTSDTLKDLQVAQAITRWANQMGVCHTLWSGSSLVIKEGDTPILTKKFLAKKWQDCYPN